MSENVVMSGWVGWCIKAVLINPLSVKSHLSDHGVEEHLLGGIHPVFASLTPFGNAGDFTTSGERKGLSWTWLLTGGGHLYSMLGEGVSWSSVVNNAHYHHPRLVVKITFTSEKTTNDIYILIILLNYHPVVPTSTTGIVGKFGMHCRAGCYLVGMLSCKPDPTNTSGGLLSVTRTGKEGSGDAW